MQRHTVASNKTNVLGIHTTRRQSLIHCSCYQLAHFDIQLAHLARRSSVHGRKDSLLVVWRNGSLPVRYNLHPSGGKVSLFKLHKSAIDCVARSAAHLEKKEESIQ